MRSRHQGGYWNEPVAGGQLQTCIVLVAAEPSVTTRNLYLGVKRKSDALESQLGSLTQRKKQMIPIWQTILKVTFSNSMVKLITQDNITLWPGTEVRK